MKKLSIILALLFITFISFPDEVIVSQSDNINKDTRLSNPIPFSITEPSFLRVKVEAQRFSPVISFDPEEGRGFQWDGEKDGILIYSASFEAMAYNVRIRASDWEGITKTEFDITITKIIPENISIGDSVSGSYLSDGEKESYDYVVWYVMEITKPGNYSALLNGDAETKLIITREPDFYRSFWFPDDYINDIPIFNIKESGLYGLKISFNEREQGEYSFTIIKN